MLPATFSFLAAAHPALLWLSLCHWPQQSCLTTQKLAGAQLPPSNAFVLHSLHNEERPQILQKKLVRDCSGCHVCLSFHQHLNTDASSL